MDLSIRFMRRRRERAGWETVRAILGWPARVANARRAMLQLGQMSSHELKDIGLTPQDLSDMTALPLDVDPTQRLAQRARERRLSR